MSTNLLRPRLLPAIVAALCALAACAPEPLLDQRVQTPPLALVPVSYAGVADGRGRFREILCRLSEHHGAELPDHRPCEEVLHELPGETTPRALHVNYGGNRSGLRLLIAPGVAFACAGEPTRPLRLAARHVAELGYPVDWVEVDGLADGAATAAAIRAAILDQPAAGPLVLLGYSKGMTDLLEALTDPAAAERVAAVISLSGAVNGSPLADQAADSKGPPLARLPGAQCTGAEHGALASLRRGLRADWLATRHLPTSIRYYSVVSFTARERVSAPLRASYDQLALIDPLNDGQLLFYDQILPTSTLLGYLNADHWAVGLAIARERPTLAAAVDRNAFPRELVLEAIVKHVEDDVAGLTREPIDEEMVVIAAAPGS